MCVKIFNWVELRCFGKLTGLHERTAGVTYVELHCFGKMTGLRERTAAAAGVTYVELHCFGKLTRAPREHLA